MAVSMGWLGWPYLEDKFRSQDLKKVGKLAMQVGMGDSRKRGAAHSQNGLVSLRGHKGLAIGTGRAGGKGM